ncbi:MAG: hypothetical protein ACTS8S_00525 [Giesbergeria sp.]
MTEVTVKTKWFTTSVVLTGSYEPAERGSFQDGLQMEPDISASFMVETVSLGDADITEIFNDESLTEMEELACKTLENPEYDYDDLADTNQ